MKRRNGIKSRRFIIGRHMRKKIVWWIVLSLVFGVLFEIRTFAMKNDVAGDKEQKSSVDIRLDEFRINEAGEEVKYTENPVILPGARISKIPRIFNEGEACYVRAKLEWNLSGLSGVYSGMGEAWSYAEDGYYYYQEILEKGECVDVFQEVVIPTDLSQELEETELRLKITAEAIQSRQFEPDWNAKSPWGDVTIRKYEEQDSYGIHIVSRTEKHGERTGVIQTGDTAGMIQLVYSVLGSGFSMSTLFFIFWKRRRRM